MKTILIQTWLGPIPDYFWYHYETTKNLNMNFLFVTDQEVVLDSQNYKVLKTTKEEIETKLSNILGVNFKIKNYKKSCDLKASFGDLYQEYTTIDAGLGEATILSEIDLINSNIIVGQTDYETIGFGIIAKAIN